MAHGFDAVRRMCPPPGALPPKRMVASWSGPHTGPTEYKVAAHGSRALAGSPRFVCYSRSQRNAQDGATRYPTVMRHVTHYSWISGGAVLRVSLRPRVANEPRGARQGARTVRRNLVFGWTRVGSGP